MKQTKKSGKLIRPKAAGDRAINGDIAADPDTYQLSAAEMKRLKPFHRMRPPSGMKTGNMNTLVIGVCSVDEFKRNLVRVWKTGKAEPFARMSFQTSDQLWNVLTAKRLELLKALCGQGPVTFRRAAALVGRDVKAVHADLTALIKNGVLDRDGAGVVLPYQTVRVEFELKAAGRVATRTRSGRARSA
jgi:predicted transcriptional regulator